MKLTRIPVAKIGAAGLTAGTAAALLLAPKWPALNRTRKRLQTKGLQLLDSAKHRKSAVLPKSTPRSSDENVSKGSSQRADAQATPEVAAAKATAKKPAGARTVAVKKAVKKKTTATKQAPPPARKRTTPRKSSQPES